MRLVCFGDSITADECFEDGEQRLTPRLREAFPDWQVINAGVSGDNTRDALLRLYTDVGQHAPDYVTVLLGANDAAFHKMIPLAEYEANLHEIAVHLEDTQLILLTPSLVDAAVPTQRHNAVLGEYAAAVRRVAARNQARLIDLHAVMLADGDYLRFLDADGLHFSPEGYRLLAELITAQLRLLERERRDWPQRLQRRRKVCQYLDDLGIRYEMEEHMPVYTIEEMERLGITEGGMVLKNLFLRNDSGKKHYLVCFDKDKKADLAALRRELGSSRLGFASAERLHEHLGLSQGEVSPLGIINDPNAAVEVVLDRDIVGLPRIGVHPNDNAASLWLSYDDLLRVIESAGNPLRLITI